MTKAKFKFQDKPGFFMTFENGWTISVQWHASAYCDSEKGESPNAEIAMWNSEGEWYNFGSDTVKGWCTPNEVAEWISKAKSL